MVTGLAFFEVTSTSTDGFFVAVSFIQAIIFVGFLGDSVFGYFPADSRRRTINSLCDVPHGEPFVKKSFDRASVYISEMFPGGCAWNS